MSSQTLAMAPCFFSSDDFSSSWNLKEILELEEHFENLMKTSWELYENTLGTNQKKIQHIKRNNLRVVSNALRSNEKKIRIWMQSS
jgi:guanylate kinase